jgi:hypothetical protein
MKFFGVLFFLLITTCIFSQKYSRVKIYTDDNGLEKLSNLGVTIDHGVKKTGFFFISDFSSSEIQRIKEHNYSIEILIDDVQALYKNQNNSSNGVDKNSICPSSITDIKSPTNFKLGSMGGFYTYQEYLDEVDKMAIQFPQLISSKSAIGNFITSENRPIYWMKISDNPSIDETDETEVFYSGVHHAREPISMTELVFYMWYLLENYSNDLEIQYLLNSTELYFVPCVNPDGYIYNETIDPTGGGMHRKNRRNVGTSNKGVDINRNYSYQWGTTGISTNPDDDTYPGSSAFSEPESQAIKWFCENRHFLFAANAHSFGNYILYPIGSTISEFAIDNEYFKLYTNQLVNQNGFGEMKSSDLYPASGDSDDFMYKDDLSNKPKIFTITPEIGGVNHGFWPASNEIEGLCKDMLHPNLMVAQLSHKYSVVKDESPSFIERLTGYFNYSAERLGIEDGTFSISIEPLKGIQSVGSLNNHTLNLKGRLLDSISFSLNPLLQFGDTIQYIIVTDYGNWQHRDTIVKRYGAITVQFSDDCSSPTNWTGGWNTSITDYHSGFSAFTDSPFGNYQGASISQFKLNQKIDLRYVASPILSFYTKWQIESNYDYCQFQVSTDNGKSWQAQCGKYTSLGVGSGFGGNQPNNQPVYDGNQYDWVREEIDLSDYLDQEINVRFLLKSDNGLEKDGFYFDDFKVNYNYDQNASIEKVDFQLNAFPNPTSNSTLFSFSNLIESGELNIFDQSGKCVLKKVIGSNETNITLDSSFLTSGVYLVKLMNSKSYSRPFKLVVLH